MSSAKDAEIEDAATYFRELSPSDQERWQAMTAGQVPTSALAERSSSATTSASGVSQILRAQSYFIRTDEQFKLLKISDGSSDSVRHVNVAATPTDIFLSDDGDLLGYRYFGSSPNVAVLVDNIWQDYNVSGLDVLSGSFSNKKLLLLARVKDELVVLSLSGGKVAELSRVRVPGTDLFSGQRCETHNAEEIAQLLSMGDDRSIVIRVQGDGQLNIGPELEGRWTQCFVARDQIVGVVQTGAGRANVIARIARGHRENVMLPDGAGRVVFDNRGDVVAAYRSVWSATDGMVPAVWFLSSTRFEPILYHDGVFGPRGSMLAVDWFANRLVLLGQHNILEYQDGIARELISRGLNTNQLSAFRSRAMAFYDIEYKQITIVSTK